MFAHYSNVTVTIIAAQTMIGDKVSPETMDNLSLGSSSEKKKLPWLSYMCNALQTHGIDYEICDWLDESIDWSSKQIIWVGPISNYIDNIEKLDALLLTFEKYDILTLNPSDFIRWNSRKTYLLALQEEKNIPLPPTFQVDSNSLQEKLEHIKGNKFVLKSTLDAGSHTLQICDKPITNEDWKNLDDIIKTFSYQAGDILLQPFYDLDGIGEYSCVFINGEKSHEFIRLGPPKENRVQLFYGATSQHFTADTFSTAKENLKKFHPGFSLTSEHIQHFGKVSQQIYTALVHYCKKRHISQPYLIRIDLFLDKTTGEILCMELEGIEPYLEAMQAQCFREENKKALSPKEQFKNGNLMNKFIPILQGFIQQYLKFTEQQSVLQSSRRYMFHFIILTYAIYSVVDMSIDFSPLFGMLLSFFIHDKLLKANIDQRMDKITQRSNQFAISLLLLSPVVAVLLYALEKPWQSFCLTAMLSLTVIFLQNNQAKQALKTIKDTRPII